MPSRPELFSVQAIIVTVRDVEAPRAEPDHPCGLGVARDHWPMVCILNRPVNQDGCEGRALTLDYDATGVEVRR